MNLASDYLYDYWRYWQHSGYRDIAREQTTLQSALIQGYHRIEKGLALPSPRPYFGHEGPVPKLVGYLEQYVERYGVDLLARIVGENLALYFETFREHPIPATLQPVWARVTSLTSVLSHRSGETQSGLIALDPNQPSPVSCTDFDQFFNARTSVRNFSHRPVDSQDIVDAVRVALKTPSVCNRQHWRVRLYEDKKEIAALLELQNGNDGFRETIDKLLLVTSDVRLFTSRGERNQGFIDGGLFCMSICLALHARALATCMLNWSRDKASDRALRNITDIAEHEIIIMMIAVGHYPSELQVAASPRQDVSEVLTVYSSQETNR